MKELCTIHASGVFSLFSALCFATKSFSIERIVYFDRAPTFKARADFLRRSQPILDYFGVKEDQVTYLLTNDQAAANFSDIYTHAGSRVLFAESLQSPDNQKLIRLIAPRELHFYAEGAMSYGPIRSGLPKDIASLIKGVHYVDYGSGLAPLAIEQFAAADRGISAQDFGASLESFFVLLDNKYRDLTQIDDFLERIPERPISLIHQNLSAISGFEPKTETGIFRSIQKQIADSWNGGVVVFMHPKGVRDVSQIFDLEANTDTTTYVSPPFPFVEYYVSRAGSPLTVGIFSTSLLNIHTLRLPVITLETHFIGGKIKSAFDSNLYALHYVQLVLGSYEHERKIYPSMDVDKLKRKLEENRFARCSVKNSKLWRLPYLIGDETVLRSNITQAKADFNSLKPYHKMPAFRRLSVGRREILATHGLPPLEVKKRTAWRYTRIAYKELKMMLSGLRRKK